MFRVVGRWAARGFVGADGDDSASEAGVRGAWGGEDGASLWVQREAMASSARGLDLR